MREGTCPAGPFPPEVHTQCRLLELGCCVKAAGSQTPAVAVPAEVAPAPGADICPCPMASCLLCCGLRELLAHLPVQPPREQGQRAQLCKM